MKLKGKNVLESYLTLLDVRFTKLFTNQFFNEYPHKNNLFRLSKMYKVDNGQVSFLWRGIEHELSFDKFCEGWSGVVQLAGTTENSIEPDYRELWKTEMLFLLKRAALIAPIVLIAGLAYNSNFYYYDKV